jgi:single-strand DNA-binding protein
MYQQVILVGNLGRDPELRYTESGTAVATLQVCTNRKWTDDNKNTHEEATWHRVVVWGKTAENANQYLAKGRLVQVVGRLQNGSYEDKDKIKRYYTEVVAQQLLFLPSGGGGNRPPHPAERGDVAPGGSRGGGNGGDFMPPMGEDDGIPDPDFPKDDDIPF